MLSRRLFQIVPALRAAALRQQIARGMATKIHYTHTDEAPMLATYALLPIIRRFTDPAGIVVEKIDISVAGRIISLFPERLRPEQRIPDTLGELGELVKGPDANIIKLPNVSASVPQLLSAIAELQAKGYNIPNYTQDPKTDEEKDFHTRYGKVLGSAVNPVLREGNSDRRVAPPVKAYAQKNPHKLGAWPKDSKTKVAHMKGNDFFGSEKSYTVPAATTVKIELVTPTGTTVLKQGLKVKDGEIIDASFMSTKHLRAFFEEAFTAAKADGVLASLHLKATMMKVSDPIMFGHAVQVFFKDLFAKHGALFKELKVNVNNGFGDLVSKIKALPEAQRKEVEADIAACYASRPALAMVDSRKGITNLHVPSDVIIDASMPVVIRDSGRMWNKEDKLQDTHCIIPDRCYSGIYRVMVEDVQKHGQFNVSTMGSTANVGLMAQKAEEYGSHDKTFQLPSAGTVRVSDAAGKVIFEHSVEAGDIWRMCQTKDAPIRDWVKLAVTRAKATGAQAIFWLNKDRAHDSQLIAKVNAYLKEHDTKGLDITIMAPEAAMAATCTRARAGKDSISVTGNVLRDYLTDLFPILELGTSAKMLSIVPMMAGGGMYETGAGGSAPKHVQQFVEEGHLRWDSLGEYLAMAVSLEDLGTKTNNARAKLLAATLMEATGKLLDNRKSPSRKVRELDNRGSHFYIALYWAQAMAKHDSTFVDLAKKIEASAEATLKELIDCQGQKVDIGGYWMLDDVKADKAMRPSTTFNKLIDSHN